MFDLLSPTNFDFLARFFLSGFILYSVRSRYVLGDRPKATEIVFESVVLSLINQLVFQAAALALSLLCLAGNWCAGALSLSDAGRIPFFIEVLVLPALLGIAFGLALRNGWNSALLRRLSMPIVHPTRQAYDFAFGENRTPCFLIVTYEDGTVVFGYFGRRSLAASDRERSDLYLERLYSVTETGSWTEVQPPRGALLMLHDVRSIEFIPSEED